MQQKDGMGLVCSGEVSQSFLARLPVLLRRLGPIKTSTFQTSRRVANTLRYGAAASHYSELEECGVILVAVAEARLDRVLRELVARTPIRCPAFPAPMVVLCECVRDSAAPGPLYGTGARVATLNLVPGTGERIFVAEGHPATVRYLRQMLTQAQRKLIVLKPGAKPLFFAGIRARAPLLLPWIEMGTECLRAAGFSRAEAVYVGEMLSAETVRKYGRSGVRNWSKELEMELRRALEGGAAPLHMSDARFTELYEYGIRIALEQCQRALYSSGLEASRRNMLAEVRPPGRAASRAASLAAS